MIDCRFLDGLWRQYWYCMTVVMFVAFMYVLFQSISYIIVITGLQYSDFTLAFAISIGMWASTQPVLWGYRKIRLDPWTRPMLAEMPGHSRILKGHIIYSNLKLRQQKTSYPFYRWFFQLQSCFFTGFSKHRWLPKASEGYIVLATTLMWIRQWNK